MPSATGLGKGAISDNAAELMGVAHRAEEGIQHGLLRLMAHRQQRCAALRSDSLRVRARVKAFGMSGCRAICAKSSAAIRSENSSIKDFINSQVFFHHIHPPYQE